MINLAIDSEYVVNGSKFEFISIQFAEKINVGVNTTIVYNPCQTLSQTLSHALKRLKKQRGDILVNLLFFGTKFDFQVFRDWKKLCRNLDSVQKTLVTVEKPVILNRYDQNHHKIGRWIITFRDVALLAPAKSSLAELGKRLGLEKVSLPAGVIDRMDLLLKTNKKLYDAYAARDAEITLLWGLKMLEVFKMKKLPVSTPSVAAKIAAREIKPLKIDDAHAELLISQSFKGGRNEANSCGITDSEVSDWDLTAAYTVSMSKFPQIDPKSKEALFGPTEAFFEVPGYHSLAQIEFRAPDAIYAPLIGIQMPGIGLIFPRQGKTVATGIEIQAAISLGYSLKFGLAMRWKLTTKSLEKCLKTLFAQRLAAISRDDRIEAEVFKLLANSMYGKTAQGVSLEKRRVYSMRYDDYRVIPRSRISDALLASYTTAFVRVVISEIVEKLRDRCLAVTTDGVLVRGRELPDDVLSGFYCKSFAESLQKLSPDKEMLQLKSLQQGCRVIRTRMAWGLNEVDGFKRSMARGGIPVSAAPDPKSIEHLYKSDVRTVEFKRFPSLMDIGRLGKMGGFAMKQQMKIQFRYDGKRGIFWEFEPLQGWNFLSVEEKISWLENAAKLMQTRPLEISEIKNFRRWMLRQQSFDLRRCAKYCEILTAKIRYKQRKTWDEELVRGLIFMRKVRGSNFDPIVRQAAKILGLSLPAADSISWRRPGDFFFDRLTIQIFQALGIDTKS